MPLPSVAAARLSRHSSLGSRPATSSGIEVTASNGFVRNSVRFEANPLQVQGRRSLLTSETFSPPRPASPPQPQIIIHDTQQASSSKLGSRHDHPPRPSANPVPAPPTLVRSASTSTRFSHTFTPSPLSRNAVSLPGCDVEEDELRDQLGSLADTVGSRAKRGSPPASLSGRRPKRRSLPIPPGFLEADRSPPTPGPSNLRGSLGALQEDTMVERDIPRPSSPTNSIPSTSRDHNENWMTTTAAPRFSRTALPSVVMPIAATAKNRALVSSRSSSLLSLNSDTASLSDLPPLRPSGGSGSCSSSLRSMSSVSTFRSTPEVKTQSQTHVRSASHATTTDGGSLRTSSSSNGPSESHTMRKSQSESGAASFGLPSGGKGAKPGRLRRMWKQVRSMQAWLP